MSSYYDLGSHTRPGVSAVPEAQLWCDRGLMWLYAFNHDEARACYEAALKADPGCAMAHWGVAYAVGPNYNRPWEFFPGPLKVSSVRTMRAALDAARACSRHTPTERALIEALALRCPESSEIEDFTPLNDAYADAMRAVHAAHPDDLDIAALFAEALMNRTPWQLWALTRGVPAPGASTAEAQAVLEHAFGTWPAAWDHPGLLHMYIHLMEMSPHPERALRHGDRLSTLAPDAGHLVHMASHIDVLTGDYQQTVSRNWAAVHADEAFRSQHGSGNFYTVYRLHDLHFVIYGAMLLAQPTEALRAADMLQAELTPEIVGFLPIAFEAFYPMRLHVQIRFGRWQDILDEPFPEDRELYAYSCAVQHYARTVAMANLGRHDDAIAERAAFDAARAAMPEDRMMINNTCLDVLAVAEAMMLGEMAYKAGRVDQGLEHLRRSVALCDALPYDEPWGFMQPTRHALGALLMDAGQFDEAEVVYRADLGLNDTLPRPCQHPRNVWALHGLHECLSRRGETVEIVHVRQLLDKALARAEVPVRASCYCRSAA